MTQHTPGKTPSKRRGEKQHVPYNANPKTVGTRSNVQMPTDVQRTADGFEDPSAFFLSPAGTEHNRTFSSAFQTPNTRSGYETQTPGTGMTGATSVGTMRRNRSRLSDLDNDEEDDEVAADDLLHDEDDLQMATPSNQYFPGRDAPSITLPSRSRLPVDSPSINIPLDALPSPSRSTRAGMSRSPRKSSLRNKNQSSPSDSVSTHRRLTSHTGGAGSSPLAHSRGPEDVTQEELDEALASQIIVDSSPLRSTQASAASPSRKTRSPSQTQKNARKSKGNRDQTVIKAREDVGDESGLDMMDHSGFDDSGDLGGDISLDQREEEGDEEEEGAAEDGRRKSHASAFSRKSNVTRAGDDDEETADREGSVSDNDNGPSFAYDAGEDVGPDVSGFDDTVQDISIGANDTDIQTDGGDISALVDDMAAGGADNGLADEEEEAEAEVDEDDDVELEEQAVAEQERSRSGSGSGEEDQDTITELPTRRPATKTKKGAASRRKAAPQQRGAREGSVAAKPRKTRVSQIGVGNDDEDEEEEDGYHGNFKTRRSNRQHFKPLEWWRNEKFEYQRGPGLPVIKEVITYPELPSEPLSQKARGRSRTGRSASAAPAKKRREYSEQPPDEEGWDAQTDPTGIVIDYPSNEEVARRVAMPKSGYDQSRSGAGFNYQKVFGEGAFMAAGMIWIKIGQKKAPKDSKDNAYVFFVAQGAVQVTIHRTSFVMAPGGQFIVPRGNQYCIENISPDREVQLFFAQARKIRAHENDAEGIPAPVELKNGNGLSTASRAGSVASNVAAPSAKKVKKRIAADVREDSEGSGSGSGSESG